MPGFGYGADAEGNIRVKIVAGYSTRVSRPFANDGATHETIARLLLECRSGRSALRVGVRTIGQNPRAPAYPVDLPAPEYGVQVQTVGRVIPPGADEEWCEVVELPGDPADTFFIGRTEVAMAPFSHHLIISFAPEGSARLDQAALGTPVECSGAHIFGTGLVTLAASATTYARTTFLPAWATFFTAGSASYSTITL